MNKMYSLQHLSVPDEDLVFEMLNRLGFAPIYIKKDVELEVVRGSQEEALMYLLQRFDLIREVGE